MSEILELAYAAACDAFGIAAVEVINAEFPVGGLSGSNVGRVESPPTPTDPEATGPGIRYDLGEFTFLARCEVSASSGSATWSRRSKTTLNASARSDEFRIVSGRELIKEYKSSPGNRRAFCSKCGSPMYGTFADLPSIRRVRLGTLDKAGGAKSVAHIWMGSKSDWFEITDRLEQFEEAPTTS